MTIINKYTIDFNEKERIGIKKSVLEAVINKFPHLISKVKVKIIRESHLEIITKEVNFLTEVEKVARNVFEECTTKIISNREKIVRGIPLDEEIEYKELQF